MESKCREARIGSEGGAGQLWMPWPGPCSEKEGYSEDTSPPVLVTQVCMWYFYTRMWVWVWKPEIMLGVTFLWFLSLLFDTGSFIEHWFLETKLDWSESSRDLPVPHWSTQPPNARDTHRGYDHLFCGSQTFKLRSLWQIVSECCLLLIFYLHFSTYQT